MDAERKREHRRIEVAQFVDQVVFGNVLENGSSVRAASVGGDVSRVCIDVLSDAVVYLVAVDTRRNWPASRNELDATEMLAATFGCPMLEVRTLAGTQLSVDQILAAALTDDQEQLFAVCPLCVRQHRQVLL